MSWREKFQDRLDNLANLSPDQLAELEADLMSEFDDIDEQNGSLADLSEINAAISQVREQATNSENSLAEMRANVHPPEDETDPDGEESEGDSDTNEDGDEGETDPEDEQPPAPTDVVPVPVAAAGGGGGGSHGVRRPSLGQLARRAGAPAKRNANAPRVTTRMVAAGDIPGFGVGQEITTSEQLSMALIRKLQALGRGGTPDDVLVASMVKEFPEERTLGADPWVNTRRIEALTKPKALVAYGGICAPLPIDYTIETIGSTDRPLKSGLPSFGASRGGVQFMTPPQLSSITPPVPWTVAMDQAGTATKSCMKVVCEPFTSAEIYGIPVCIEVGNMMGKYNPEQVTSQTALLDVATARTAELTLLNLMDAGSTALTATDVLGATRTVLATLDRLISAYEYRNRLGMGALRVVLPDWVHDMIRADMTMEMAHDADGRDPLAITDAQIASWFGARNCSPIWTLEDLAASWKAQAAGPLNEWPLEFVAYFFAEGTWQFLDGGQIDLGVVRDSTLNSTNDYQIWREDFEGLAKRGNISYKVTITCAPTGLSAGTVATGGAPA
jgi:hypothetical protein